MDIINTRQERKVLTARNVEEIKLKTDNRKQSELFLFILYTKPDTAYVELLDVLKVSNQEMVANLLEPPMTGELYSILTKKCKQYLKV